MKVFEIIQNTRDIGKLDLINILSNALSTSKEKLLMNANNEIPESKLAIIQELFHKRRRGVPLAYITNKKEFYSETFFVDERVLIPRPETERLVEEAIRIISEGNEEKSVIDMGTGSGVIAITVAKQTKARVVGVDISKRAIQVAKKNALMAGITERLHFVCSDLFAGLKKGRHYDVIIANLPYVPEERWSDLMPEVRLYEPKRALAGGAGGLEIYRRFSGQLQHFLKKGGHVLCEIDGPVQGKSLGEMLTSRGMAVDVKKDYSERERIVTGLWTNSL